MAKATVQSVSARVDALERTVLLLTEQVVALTEQAIAPVEPAPAQAPAKAPRTTKCSCGREFKRGRLVSEAAAHPLGLCGLKGLSAHSA